MGLAVIQLLLVVLQFYNSFGMGSDHRVWVEDARSLVTLNPGARLGFGLQVTLPLSFFAPKWGIFGAGRHSKAWQFTPAHRRPPQRPSAALLACRDEEQAVPVEDYLNLLNINVEPCQERFICELALDPEMFRPLSDILLKKVAQADILQRREQSHSGWNTTTHWLARAARIGLKLSHGPPDRSCGVHFRKCPVAAEDMVDTTLLAWWKLLSAFVRIQFLGEIMDRN